MSYPRLLPPNQKYLGEYSDQPGICLLITAYKMGIMLLVSLWQGLGLVQS